MLSGGDWSRARVAGVHTGEVSSSLRLSIVETALAEIMARLDELPPGETKRDLELRAIELDLELTDWQRYPPNEGRRREMVGKAMALVTEVMRLRHADGADPRIPEDEDG